MTMTRGNFAKEITPAMKRTAPKAGKALKGSTSGSYRAPKKGGEMPRNIRRGC